MSVCGDWHADHGGRLVDFAGWAMPVQYNSIVEEHQATRQGAGLFDVSHMGQLSIEGNESLATELEKIIPIDLKKIKLNQSKYSFLTNEEGGIHDDLIVTKVEKGFNIILNAACKNSDFKIISSSLKNKFKIILHKNLSLIALQGPKSSQILEKIINGVSSLKFMNGNKFSYNNKDVYITRSGYTGEDGFEIILHDPSSAIKIWESIILHGKSFGLIPCGLGARDTLRIEAGLCLYGNELNEKITPVEAGLEWIVSSDKSDFIGKEKIMEQIDGETKRSRIGLNMDDRGIPRDGFQINNGSDKIGYVTSGTYSPLLKRGIAMGYVESEHCKDGKELTIEITGDNRRAVVTRPPFYDKSDYGWKRSRIR